MRIAHLSNNKKLLASVAGVAAVAVVGTTVGYQSLTSTVTLTLDGKSQEVRVMASDVREVLDDQGVEVSEHDVVTPALDSEIGDGTVIDVKYARPIDLTVDGKDSTHWVTATSVAGALDEIGGPFDRSEVSVSRSSAIGRSGLDLEVITPKSVKVAVGGKKATVEELPVSTVGEALEALDLTLRKHDQVKPAVGATLKDGDKIVLTRVRVVTKKVTGEVIAHKTTRTNDDSMDKGTTDTVTEGKNGARNSTYRITYRNGKLVAKKLVTSTVTAKAVTEVVKVGTKEEEPEPTPASSTPAPNFASGNSVWDALARCESGGNWATNTGNGYYGGLQFSAGTWASVGGTGLPHQHSREEQIKRGQILQSRAGWGQWPHCAGKLGLL